MINMKQKYRLFQPMVQKRQISQQHQDLLDRTKKSLHISYSDIYGIVIHKGSKGYVWDLDGRKYHDLLMGISANNQGHSHPRIRQAIIHQSSLVQQTNRLINTQPCTELAELLHSIFKYQQFFPTSTGAEACETAVKIARRWGYIVKKVDSNKANVLMMNDCFWGRTITASGGSNDHIRKNMFGPFGDGFPLVDFNNVEVVEHYLQNDPNCVAIMLESIQGQGGVIIPDQDYLPKIRQLCDQYNVLLICDEVQVGLGRTGMMGCYQYYLEEHNKPDLVVLAKSLSGGFYPYSGVMGNHDVMDSVKPGDHGSTFGGNPLGAAISIEAIKVIQDENMCYNSIQMGSYMLSQLSDLKAKSHHIKQVRGKGLFIGVEFYDPEITKQFVQLMFQNGVILSSCKGTIVRLIPYLGLSIQDAQEILQIIQYSLDQIDQ